MKMFGNERKEWADRAKAKAKIKADATGDISDSSHSSHSSASKVKQSMEMKAKGSSKPKPKKATAIQKLARSAIPLDKLMPAIRAHKKSEMPSAPNSSDSSHIKITQEPRSKFTGVPIVGGGGTTAAQVNSVGKTLAATVANRIKVRRVTLPDRTQLKISGIETPAGARYINVSDGVNSVWSSKASWAGSSKGALDNLTDGNIVIVGSTAELRDSVARYRSYTMRPVIAEVGWTDGHYGYPDRTVISPEGSATPIVLYAGNVRACGRAGTLDGWRLAIEPLGDQPLCAFYTMAALSAPLLPYGGLSFNPGFELQGAAATGKTSLLRIVASVAGPGVDNSGRRYMIDLNTTANGMETAFARFRHMPLVADEAALFMPTASATARAAGLVELIFRNASGTTKARYHEADQIVTPFVWFVSTNVSLPSVPGRRNAELHAALSDRLMSTPIDLNAPHGVFHHLPEGIASGSDLIARLLAGITANYGVALPAFIEHLIRERAADEVALDRRVKDLTASFLLEVGVHQNSSLLRVAQAFGFVYAAGMLAKRYGVLPRSFQCMRAARDCYNLHCIEGRPALQPFERLQALTAHPNVIDLDVEDPSEVTKERADRAPGFWRSNKHGEREFLMPPRQLRRHFPQWLWDKDEPRIAKTHRHDKGRGEKKRPIPHQDPWVYCFVFAEKK